VHLEDLVLRDRPVQKVHQDLLEILDSLESQEREVHRVHLESRVLLDRMVHLVSLEPLEILVFLEETVLLEHLEREDRRETVVYEGHRETQVTPVCPEHEVKLVHQERLV